VGNHKALTLDPTTPLDAYTTKLRPIGGNVLGVAANQRRYGSMLTRHRGEHMLPAWVTDWIADEHGAPTGVRAKLVGVIQARGRIRYAIYNQHSAGQHKLILGYAYLDDQAAWDRLVARFKAEWALRGVRVELAAMAPSSETKAGLLDDFWEGVERRGEGAVDQLLDRDDFDFRKKEGLGPKRIIIPMGER
jgi:hypothetical protein